jgi:glycosyltransferase involved in cell wall biosynthesis
MSQGLPVIVANNTALPLLVADGVNGFCIDTFDSEKLAEKIRYIHTHANSSLVKKMRKANETFGLAHSWRSVAGMIDVLLSESKESRVVREGGKQRYAAIK